MSRTNPTREDGRLDILELIDASSGNFYSLGQGFTAGIGIVSRLDEVTGKPRSGDLGEGHLDPRHFRFHDLKKLTPWGTPDRRLGVQILLDYYGSQDAPRPGDAPFGQPEYFTSANGSTRFADSQDRVALGTSLERIIDDEAGRYSRALTCPALPMSEPPTPSTREKKNPTAGGDASTTAKMPPGVTIGNVFGVPVVTVRTGAFGTLTFQGQTAVQTAQRAAAAGKDAAGIYADLRKAIPIVAAGTKQSQKLKGEGGGTLGLDLSFDGIGTIDGKVTGLSFDATFGVPQLLADAAHLDVRANDAFYSRNYKTAHDLQVAASKLRAKAQALAAEAAQEANAKDASSKADGLNILTLGGGGGGGGSSAGGGGGGAGPIPAGNFAGLVTEPSEIPGGYVWDPVSGRAGLLATVFHPGLAFGELFKGREQTLIGVLPIRHDAQFAMPGKASGGTQEKGQTPPPLTGRIRFESEDAAGVSEGDGELRKGWMAPDTSRANVGSALGHETCQWVPVIRVDSRIPAAYQPPNEQIIITGRHPWGGGDKGKDGDPPPPDKPLGPEKPGDKPNRPQPGKGQKRGYDPEDWVLVGPHSNPHLEYRPREYQPGGASGSEAAPKTDDGTSPWTPTGGDTKPQTPVDPNAGGGIPRQPVDDPKGGGQFGPKVPAGESPGAVGCANDTAGKPLGGPALGGPVSIDELEKREGGPAVNKVGHASVTAVPGGYVVGGQPSDEGIQGGYFIQTAGGASVGSGAWGEYNLANLPLRLFGAPDGPKYLDDAVNLLTLQARAMQDVVLGLAGGPQFFAGNIGVEHRNTPGNGPVASRIGSRYTTRDGETLKLDPTTSSFEVVQILDATRGNIAMETGRASGAHAAGVMTLSREVRGTVTDTRALLWLDPDRTRTGKVSSPIIDTPLGFRVTSDGKVISGYAPVVTEPRAQRYAQPLIWDGTTYVSGLIDLGNTDVVGGVLKRGYGGTGLSAGTQYAVLYWDVDVADALAQTSAPTDGYVLMGTSAGFPVAGKPDFVAPSFKDSLFSIQNAADPTKLIAFDASAISAASTRTFKAPDNDGTLAAFPATMAAGDLVYALTATTTSRLPIGASGTLLRSTGTAPAWVTHSTALDDIGSTTGAMLYRAAGGTGWQARAIGSSGEVLTVSGGVPTWAAPTIAAHNLLSASHGDTTVGTVARGDVITGQGATPKWTRLAKGTANQVLVMDGTATDVAWATLTSAHLPTIDHGAGLTGLSDDDHTIYALLAGRAGGQTLSGGNAASELLTLQGTAHATPGVVRALASSSDTNSVREILRVSHTSNGVIVAGFGAALDYYVDNGSAIQKHAARLGVEWTDQTDASEDATFKLRLIRAGTLTDALAINSVGEITTGIWKGTAVGPTFGGTGQTTYATGDVLYASAANTLGKLAAGTNGHVLTLAAGVPTWAAPSGGDHGALTGLGDDDHTQYLLVSGARAMSGALLLADGTEAAPGLSFSSDTNTGVYSAGADTLGFATGGTARATLSGASLSINVLENITRSSAGTNDVLNALALYRATTGTAAAGLGISLDTYLENAAGNAVNASSEIVKWTDATDTSEDASWTLRLVRAGTLTDALVVNSLGQITTGEWQGTTIALAKGGTGATDASGARTNLGLVIGTDVQAWDQDLADLAGLTRTRGDLIYGGAAAWTDLAIGTAGQVLTVTDIGAGVLEPRWATSAAGSSTLLDGSVHTDTLAGSVAEGDLIIGNATPKWSRLAIGVANRALVSNGTTATWAQLDHGAGLTGLGDDDHTIYALLAGRAGGQTLKGGTAASEILILESTAHATKGSVKVIGNLLANTDATYDIGATGATRFRDLFLSGAVKEGAWQATAIGAGYGGTGLDGSSAANGKLLIGNGTGYTLANLTQGSGITITNGAGSVTIAATGSSEKSANKVLRSMAFA